MQIVIVAARDRSAINKPNNEMTEEQKNSNTLSRSIINRKDNHQIKRQIQKHKYCKLWL